MAVKSFAFRVVAVNAPNSAGERPFYFRRLEPLLDDLKRIVRVDDWNAFLDPKLDRVERSATGLNRCESSLVDFMARFDLVDRFCLDPPGREMWIDSFPSVRIRA